VVLLQSNVGFWACGWIGKGQLILILSQFSCGLWICGGSQIVDRKTQLYVICCTGAKQCGLLGLWADWKGAVNFDIISLYLWAVDLWVDLK
jgi:hypothetical protein